MSSPTSSSSMRHAVAFVNPLYPTSKSLGPRPSADILSQKLKSRERRDREQHPWEVHCLTMAHRHAYLPTQTCGNSRYQFPTNRYRFGRQPVRLLDLAAARWRRQSLGTSGIAFALTDGYNPYRRYASNASRPLTPVTQAGASLYLGRLAVCEQDRLCRQVPIGT